MLFDRASHRVRQAVAASFVPLTVLISSAALAGPPGVTYMQLTASGLAEPVSIAGTVYQDTNRNGAADPIDKGLPGILVTLRREADGTVVGGTTTGPDGAYAFDALPPEVYRLEHTPPTGWHPVRPAARSVWAHTVGVYGGVDFFDSNVTGPTAPWPICPETPIGGSGSPNAAAANASPTVADDGTVAFLSDGSLARGSSQGQGALGTTQLFLRRPSASPGVPGRLVQLTTEASSKNAPVISRDGSAIVSIDDRPITPGGLPAPNVYLISTTANEAGRYPAVRLTDAGRDGAASYISPAVSSLTDGRYRVLFVKVVQGQQRVMWADVPAPLRAGALNAVRPALLVNAPAARPSIDASGSRVAYVTPDGSGRSQIRLFFFGGPIGTIRVVTNAATGISTNPRLSGNGNMLVFESTANLVSRGNVDGNQELFLYNIGRGRLAQLTNTTSSADHAVANTSPSIDGSGARIAFLSNAGFNQTNPDGSIEVYVWSSGRILSLTATGLFGTAQMTVTAYDPCGALLSHSSYSTGTVALAKGTPSIRGDGREVVFLSNANFAPDTDLSSPNTDNRDLSPEVFVAGGF